MRKADALKVLGERVASLRRERDLTQEQLAERAGVSRNHIADIELGARNTGAWSLILVARALDVPPSELFRPFDKRR
jgi:transcriptional regulator with XRE-family HTH domain